MKSFAINQLFMHGHFTSPAGLAALGLLPDASARSRPASVLDASARSPVTTQTSTNGAVPASLNGSASGL